MSLSQHAVQRSQQRGIPPIIIEWLEDHGEQKYDHHGGLILHFSKRSRRELEKRFGREPVRRMSEFLDCYAVIGQDGHVVTAGKRYKRLPRN